MKNSKVISMWEHNGWGDSIYFTHFEDRQIAGHMTPIPKKGDILRAKMQSGKIARFKVKKVERMADPPDQFFAKVSDIGYE